MNTYEAAQEWLKDRPLDWRLRKVPRRLRDSITEAYVLNRGRLSGAALENKIMDHVTESSSVPLWLITPLLEVAIRLMIKLLEKWWNSREIVGHA